jgi:hypothetical protein
LSSQSKVQHIHLSSRVRKTTHGKIRLKLIQTMSIRKKWVTQRTTQLSLGQMDTRAKREKKTPHLDQYHVSH